MRGRQRQTFVTRGMTLINHKFIVRILYNTDDPMLPILFKFLKYMS